MNIYKESKLSNGLRVVTCQRPGLEVINLRIQFSLGSRDEDAETFGYSHFLEHMLLQGTQRWSTPEEVDAVLNKVGGYHNGYTSTERTWYVAEVVKEDASLAVDFLSELIINPLFPDERLKHEQEVVLEEIKRAESDRARFATILSYRKFFTGHPLERYVALGDSSVIKDITITKLQTYYKQHYRPDRAVIVVISDFNHEDIASLVEKYFCRWLADENKYQPIRSDFNLTTQRLFQLDPASPQTYLRVMYPTFGANIGLNNLVIFDIIEDYLNITGRGILFHRLRERGLIYGISSFQDIYADAGVFTISTSTTKPEEVLMIIDRVIAEMPEKITSQDIEVSKARIRKQFIRQITDQETVINSLSYYYSLFGKLIEPEVYFEALKKVSIEKVKETVYKYFSSNLKFIGVLGQKDI